MRITKTGIIISIATLIIAIIAIIYLSRPQGQVDFAVAPSEVIMKIDNKSQTIRHKQSVKLAPGTYDAMFISEGFKSKKKTIVIENNKQIRIVIALTPLTDEARKKINDNPESLIIVNEYKRVRYNELLATLPLTGVNYEMIRCSSVKSPDSDTKAVCITVDSTAGKSAALLALRQLDFDTNELELLIGSKTQKIILETDKYRIDYYTNVKQEDSNKTSLFITPLNVPFVAYDVPLNEQLESIKTDALKALAVNGYEPTEYDIFYSSIYLSKYNPNADQTEAHAMAPIN